MLTPRFPERTLDALMKSTRRRLAEEVIKLREHASHPYITRLERENAQMRDVLTQLARLWVGQDVSRGCLYLYDNGDGVDIEVLRKVIAVITEVRGDHDR